MENDGPKLRGFRDSLVNDKLENNNMATAASSGTISRRPHLLDNAPNYLSKYLGKLSKTNMSHYHPVLFGINS